MANIDLTVQDSRGRSTSARVLTEVIAQAGPRWSDPGFWAPFLGSARLPTIADTVTLPATLPPLLYDVDDGAIGTLTTHTGFKVLPGAARRLLVGTNFIQHHGRFEIITPDPFEMHWPLVNESTFVGGHTDIPLSTDPGLWLMDCDVEIAGKYEVPWALLARDAQAGETEILLDRDVTWPAGAEIAVTPTLPITTPGMSRFTLPVPGAPASQTELWRDAYDVAVVISTSGRTVRIDRPLRYAHPRCGPWADGTAEGAEVLLLSRNVRITGRPGGRSHILCMAHAGGSRQIRIADMEGQYLGPVAPDPNRASRFVGRLGRYGLHFHMLGEAARGARVERVVLRDLGNHAFVSHASHGVTYMGAVAHNVFRSEPFWWDASGSTAVPGGFPENQSHDVAWDQCVASRVLSWPNADGRMAGFMTMRGFRNRAVECRAVGIQGLSNSAGLRWPEGESHEASGAGVWEVRRLVVHNCRNGTDTWQNTGNPHVVLLRSRIYRCESALQHGAYGNRYRYEGFETRECRSQVIEVATSAPPEPITVQDATFHGFGPYMVWVKEHVFPPEIPSRYLRCRFTGTLETPIPGQPLGRGVTGPVGAVFLFNDPATVTEWTAREVIDCDFGGLNEAWFTDTCHPNSRMIIQDASRHLMLQRWDQPGDYYEPLWNASVRRL